MIRELDFWLLTLAIWVVLVLLVFARPFLADPCHWRGLFSALCPWRWR